MWLLNCKQKAAEAQGERAENPLPQGWGIVRPGSDTEENKNSEKRAEEAGLGCRKEPR